ncbi:MAG: hypothetical protein ACKO2V_16620, partial [Snowella sp.]
FMLNKIFEAVKRFFRFFIEKPGARMDWTWSVDAPNSSYKNSSTNDSISSREFQGFGPKGWVPAQIDYYGSAMKQDDGTQTGNDVWTTEKLVQMSHALAQSYDETSSGKDQGWTAEKLINMSDSLAHSSVPGIDQLKKS